MVATRPKGREREGIVNRVSVIYRKAQPATVPGDQPGFPDWNDVW